MELFSIRKISVLLALTLHLILLSSSSIRVLFFKLSKMILILQGHLYSPIKWGYDSEPTIDVAPTVQMTNTSVVSGSSFHSRMTVQDDENFRGDVLTLLNEVNTFLARV